MALSTCLCAALLFTIPSLDFGCLRNFSSKCLFQNGLVYEPHIINNAVKSQGQKKRTVYAIVLPKRFFEHALLAECCNG